VRKYIDEIDPGAGTSKICGRDFFHKTYFFREKKDEDQFFNSIVVVVALLVNWIRAKLLG